MIRKPKRLIRKLDLDSETKTTDSATIEHPHHDHLLKHVKKVGLARGTVLLQVLVLVLPRAGLRLLGVRLGARRGPGEATFSTLLRTARFVFFFFWGFGFRV